ncbi:VIT family protein [Gleimia sp. 6138-11-ORH1]|uniref:VIT1/CCC1 transporter family protein n=1 Tax=Gleimia sp. 6138-11-ORH1 TaxID=2973937 RepID=UPI00216758F9|nr:VIT family protein [Gleimia sp. 6138-11-ORH1]MCS4484119.1 VIT family protein [Gleimia sp. 6138-11-ORH1]
MVVTQSVFFPAVEPLVGPTVKPPAGVNSQPLGCARKTPLDEVQTRVPAETGSSISARLNWLRAAVLGANDGIVSISGLVVGVAAVDPTNTAAIALAGAAGIVAASLSMSVGEYVSVSTQLDTERQLVKSQTLALNADPLKEESRLAQLWEAEGLSQATAVQVAKELSAKDPVRAHLTVAHGIDPEDLTSPWAAAFSSFVAFVIGALLPFLTMLLMPATVRIPATFGAVIMALALTGYISAWLGKANRLKATIRLVAGGAFAMGLTYLVGNLFGVAV